MLRKLIEVVTGIVIALNDNRSVRRKAYVPADKTDLGNYHRSLGAHSNDLIPHRENKALKYGTCHGVLLIKDLGLIDREIGDLAGLLINGRCHAAVIEIIYTVAVIAESAAGTGHMDLALTLDRYDSDCVNSIRINRAYCRMLDDDFFEEMRTLLIYQAFVYIFSLFSLAVDLLYSLAAGTEIGLGNKEIMVVNEVYYFLLVIFPDLKPLTAQELTETLIELDLVVDQIGILGIVISLNEFIVTAPGDICVTLFVVEVIHLIEPVIHVTCAEFSAAVNHVEKDPHARFTALLVDILDLGAHRLIIHARNAPNEIT